LIFFGGGVAVATKEYNPLTSPVPPEIHLSNSPLIRVITQIRFPIIASIEKQEFIAGFQESIRERYPILRSEQTQNIILGPQGIESIRNEVTWRFNDSDGKWRVSLAPEFLAFETTSYTSRGDFMERLGVVLNALDLSFGPKIVDRIGIRYIDRITGDQLTNINNLIEQEMLGILTTFIAGYAKQCLSESLFNLPDIKAGMLMRWGRVQEKSTVDPAAIEPIPIPSWILDIDVFSLSKSNFNKDLLIENVRKYSERTYTFFRWAVKDEFLKQYGGEI
jgi:uncharacterized protein (TIGR04255 family)